MYTTQSLFLKVQLYCKLSLLIEKCYVVTFQGRVIKIIQKLKSKWVKRVDILGCLKGMQVRNSY